MEEIERKKEGSQKMEKIFFSLPSSFLFLPFISFPLFFFSSHLPFSLLLFSLSRRKLTLSSLGIRSYPFIRYYSGNSLSNSFSLSLHSFLPLTHTNVLNSSSLPFPLLSGVAYTQGRRPTMEDTHILTDDIRPLISKRAKLLGISGDVLEGVPPIGMYCIFDGHGGSQVTDTN